MCSVVLFLVLGPYELFSANKLKTCGGKGEELGDLWELQEISGVWGLTGSMVPNWLDLIYLGNM